MQLHFWLQAYAAQLQNGSWPIAHSQKRTEASMLSYSQRSSPVHCYPLRLHLPAETFRFVSHQTTCNVTMHPQVSTAFLALWFWLRVKVLPASTFCFFFFSLSLWASILTLGSSWVKGIHLLPSCLPHDAIFQYPDYFSQRDCLLCCLLFCHLSRISQILQLQENQ